MTCKIKICGVTSEEDVTAALDAGSDALGFNFYEASRRSVAVDQAQKLVELVPMDVWKVGVFVNHPRELVANIAERVGLDSLQFSGDEPLSFCEGWGAYRIIKAIRIAGQSEISNIDTVMRQVDIVLFDAYSATAYGGTGEEISQELLSQLDRILPQAFLSGGLTAENVAQKVAQFRPLGVDVASGVESRPGVKDPEKIREFVEAVRLAGNI